MSRPHSRKVLTFPPGTQRWIGTLSEGSPPIGKSPVWSTLSLFRVRVPVLSEHRMSMPGRHPGDKRGWKSANEGG